MYKRWNNIYYKSYNSLVLVTPRIKQKNPSGHEYQTSLTIAMCTIGI